METGTVKWYKEDKGYGFVTRDDGGGDILVHFRDIEAIGLRRLYEGQRVKFNVVQGPRGPQAKNIQLI
jgi:CspA family cold shock protein